MNDLQPGHIERSIAKALLSVSDEAHQAYHDDPIFRVTVNSLAATLLPVMQDLTSASQTRRSKW